MELVLAQSALDDLRALQDYYLEQGVPEVGERFVRDIFAAIQRLTNHPDSGRMVPEFNQSTIREVIFPPYRIVYLREAGQVSIVRVWW